jgi:electron transport complex protein RnfB
VNRTDDIDALLPQTQCTRCGYPACRPYAEAIALGEADINQCPPGGEPVIEALARLLDRPPKPLNPDNGVEAAPRVAVIDETRCIGCAKCLPACPVDAIVGARRYMHTVIADACNGCDLCIAPCPVDCIDMVPVAQLPQPLQWPQIQQRAATWRPRHAAHVARRERDAAERMEQLAVRKRAALSWSDNGQQP